MQAQRILLVESDASIRAAVSRLLDRLSYQVLAVGSITEVQNILNESGDLAAVILRDRLNGQASEILLQNIKNSNINIRSYIMCSDFDPRTMLSFSRLGVDECFQIPDQIQTLVQSVDRDLKADKASVKPVVVENLDIHKSFEFDNIIGRSPEITKVMELVDKVAKSDSTILIMGESGTGKELIARALHYNSNRHSNPIVPVNCGAIPGELLESELFGHVKGAFTGAVNNRLGRFQLAEKGSLFLDEIGDMPLNLQVKLLRVLQEKRLESVGSQKTEATNVRLIAATNVDLEQQVSDGKFREDLFYRLNVIPIVIPALRERKSDIPLLVHHFVKQFNQEKNSNIHGVSPEAMAQLMKYDWPGNIRELENLMERLSVLVGEGIVQVEDLPEKYLNETQRRVQAENTIIGDEGIDFNSVVDEFENRLILQALQKTGWNRNQAAKLLRLNRTTLVEKIKKKGLQPQEIQA
ncbi:MAG: sigma 54-interacting transcriptional regulator [Bdellovibrionales bacterium]